MPTYDAITPEIVQKACQELGIRDWTSLTEARVLNEEAQVIQQVVGAEALQISVDEFRQGLEVELEHGIRFKDANVTNNHPVLTGMIVLAHLKETLDYYLRLEVAELEGDMLKASRKGNSEKVNTIYKKLLSARKILVDKEAADL